MKEIQKKIQKKITIPKGAHAAFIGHQSNFPDQQEVSLPRNSKFQCEKSRVIKDKISNNEYESLQIDVSMLKKK